MLLTIKSEDDAWALLNRAIDGEVFDEHTELHFDGWPVFEMTVRGREWHSSVPTRVMTPLLEVQRDLNRAFAEVRYGSPNLQKLKDEERDQLELVVKVKEGSSDFTAELAKQFTEMASIAFGRMDGSQAMITVLGLSIAVGGTFAYKAWLDYRLKLKGLDNESVRSQEETKRMQIMADVVRIQPAIQTALNNSIETNNRLLKALKPDDQLTYKGLAISGAVAAEVTQPERAASEDLQINGVFRVLGNRTDKGLGFRITVQRVSDELVVTADVPDEINALQKAAIKEAEWGKWLLDMSIDASVLRESIHSAVVVSAKRHQANERAPEA